jgi:hypothetical protein
MSLFDWGSLSTLNLKPKVNEYSQQTKTMTEDICINGLTALSGFKGNNT